MNMLFVSQYYPPETGAGATRTEAMVKYLSRLGWQMEVVSELPNYPTGNIYPGYKQVFHQQEQDHGASIHRVWVWANPRSNLREQLGIFGSFLVSALCYIIGKPKRYDVVYATSPPIFAAIAGALIAKLLRTRFVLEVRDIWPDAAVDAGKIKKRSFYFKMGRRIEHWLYQQADLIVPVTGRSESIIRRRCGETPTHVVFNGVDLEHFHRVECPQNQIDEPLDESRFRVGYVGSLGVIHDLATFVRAAKLCEDDPDIEFIIVGDGGSRAKLEQVIAELRPRNLKWVGLKEHQKVPAYISSFDVAVNPVYDADIFKSIITVKFFEYLACETPVISLAKGLMKEEGDRSGAVITLPPEEPEQLANTIKDLKAHPDKLQKLSEHARDFIVQNYSREEQAHKLSGLLQQLIGRAS